MHVAMIVIRSNHKLFSDLLLHANTKAVSEWRVESVVDARGQDLCGNRGMCQRAKRTPEKETGRFTDCNTRCVCILLRSKSGKLLYIRDVEDRICGNNCVSRCHYFVKPI